MPAHAVAITCESNSEALKVATDTVNHLRNGTEAVQILYRNADDINRVKVYIPGIALEDEEFTISETKIGDPNSSEHIMCHVLTITRKPPKDIPQPY
jgi:hypothetical protein